MTAPDTDISFVIVSWNAKGHLRNCLLSLRSGIGNLRGEVIVVDNASEDGSWEMVSAEFPEVQLIRNSNNTGFATANNQGIKLARGRYLCLVNSDVEVFPKALPALVEYMEKEPKIGILGPKVLNTDRSLQPSCRTSPTIRSSFFRALQLDTWFPNSRLFGAHQMTDWNYDRIRDVEILSGCFWLIRRSALNEVGMLDTQFFMYGEDMDFCMRYRKAGWNVVFYPDAQIVHHGGASSANAPARFWVEMQRANLQFWLKHHGRMQMRVYHGCLVLHNAIRCIGFGLRCLFGASDIPRQKLHKHWKGLKWLLQPTTLCGVLKGSF